MRCGQLLLLYKHQGHGYRVPLECVQCYWKALEHLLSNKASFSLPADLTEPYPNLGFGLTLSFHLYGLPDEKMAQIQILGSGAMQVLPTGKGSHTQVLHLMERKPHSSLLSLSLILSQMRAGQETQIAPWNVLDFFISSEKLVLFCSLENTHSA